MEEEEKEEEENNITSSSSSISPKSYKILVVHLKKRNKSTAYKKPKKKILKAWTELNWLPIWKAEINISIPKNVQKRSSIQAIIHSTKALIYGVW